MADFSEIKHVLKSARKKTKPFHLPMSLKHLKIDKTQEVVKRGVVEEDFLIHDNKNEIKFYYFVLILALKFSHRVKLGMVTIRSY